MIPIVETELVRYAFRYISIHFYQKMTLSEVYPTNTNKDNYKNLYRRTLI